MVAVMGGAKVSDKILLIENLLPRVDKLLIGGAMTYTFLKAQGHAIGKSRCEDDRLDEARRLLETARRASSSCRVDHLVADKLDRGRRDAGRHRFRHPRRLDRHRHRPGNRRRRTGRPSKGAGTVVWNGPVGKFEDEPFRKGTTAVAEAMAASQATTVVGGGETAEAVEEFGLARRWTTSRPAAGPSWSRSKARSSTPSRSSPIVDRHRALRRAAVEARARSGALATATGRLCGACAWNGPNDWSDGTRPPGRWSPRRCWPATSPGWPTCWRP